MSGHNLLLSENIPLANPSPIVIDTDVPLNPTTVCEDKAKFISSIVQNNIGNTIFNIQACTLQEPIL